MARRRSKWRKTWQIVKKMMQEARKARAQESLRQCPVCGNPHSLSIEVKEDKWTSRKTAYIRCSVCGFETVLENLPPIADEFWIYSRVLDMVQSSTPVAAETEASEAKVEASEEVSTSETEEIVHIEIEEIGEEEQEPSNES